MNKPAMSVGDEFTFKNKRFKVKKIYLLENCANSGWYVLAWRFVKTTQKFSGAAYSYRWNDDEMKVIS